ncbi:sugar phosphate isomerase/epimerase family protein [Streptomyces beihaiensis]|uniref:Sugar phosphate isomerase/epimerase n=1 Tax=Streptomyces beihaiensis TaxID=2984495 RepID=A0ABT3TSI9_9ACTN|nr:sugar phosphate isomerase/epimerase family protein [Streptomyces beihaiensis]MCX3059476.1 sugar phosphate isomerase/epimerase [Streptomyces beihaiensis]
MPCDTAAHAGRTRRGEAAPGVLYAGIGDEAGRGLGQQIAALHSLGWQLIELRTVDGTAVADLDDAAFDDCVQRIGEAGLTTACVDSRIADWSRPISQGIEADLTELDRLGSRCAALRTRYVRVMSYPNDGWDEESWGAEVIRRTRLLAARAAEYGLVLLHENCAGWAGRSAERMLRLLAEVDSPALRLLFDTGNGAAYHYDAYDVLTELLRQCPEAVAHVHVKDAVGSGDSAAYTLPGQGTSRVASCLRLLHDSGFAGVWSIEPHLALRPHVSRTELGEDGPALFAEYGRHLERLVAEEVLEPRHHDARKERPRAGSDR